VTEPRWRSLLPRSLTARLVTGVVALVLTVVALVSAGTYLALRSFLFDRLDQQLASTAAGSPNAINQLFGSVPDSLPDVSALTPQHVWVVALARSGEVAARPQNPAVEAMELTSSQRLEMVKRSPGQPLTLRTADGIGLRVRVVQGPLYLGRIPVVVVVGLSTQDVDHTIGRLLTLELAIGAGAVVVAALATGYGVRLGLRPLYHVSETAQEVAAELSPEGAGLDRRVPVHQPGTEVGTLAESMNTLLSAVETQFAARLESENRMRQFLADASHELRTPLTSIRGYAELARMQRGLGDGEDNLARIESEGTRMSRLVEDLLTLARSDQGAASIVRVPVSLDDVIDDVVASSRAAFPARRIDVSLPSPELAVLGDHDALVRVIRNLVTNAATYTRPDGPIGVRAYPEGSGATIQVLDSGPGLPPEEAAHVFERFWRADKARSRASGGSGLGLSIVASLVQAHGGTVRFDSSVETGSTVSVWLPGVSVDFVPS